MRMYTFRIIIIIQINAIIIYNGTIDIISLPVSMVGCIDKSDASYKASIKKESCDAVLYFTFLESNRMFAIKTVKLRFGNANPQKKNKIILDIDKAALFSSELIWRILEIIRNIIVI